MDVRIEPAHAWHAKYLSGRLRAADVEEIEAASGRTPEAALFYSLGASDEDMRWACLYDGLPVALFGVGGVRPDAGSVWLLGSDELTRPAKTFLRLSREYVDLMHTRYPLLFNRVDDRHRESQRWLRWLGFEPVGDFPEYGPEGRPFTYYESFRYV